MRAKRWSAVAGVLALGALIAAALVAFGPEVEQQPEPPPLPAVRVVRVQPQNVRVEVRSQGETQPRTRSQLVAQVPGRISRVAADFAAGGYFERGQPLVWIDPADYKLAVQQAEAQVAQARVALAQERAQAQVAREEWQSLGRGKPNALVLREPQLAQAQAALEAARAALEQAKLQLARTTVTAPYAGRVRSTSANVGQYVAPGATLADIYATDYAEVRLPVQEADLAFLPVSLGYPEERGPGPPVTLSNGGQSWQGEVVRVGGTVDPKTRLLEVYARVPDPFNRRRDAHRAPLPMGLFVEARIQGRMLEDVFVLPRSALRDAQVLVIEDGRIAFRDVEVVRLRGDEAVLRSGLRPGDAVVVSRLETPVAGMPVRVTPASDAPRD